MEDSFLTIFLVSFCLLHCESFSLTVLHTNDVHSRVEEINTHGGVCTVADSTAGNCYGGVARRHQAVTSIRQNKTNVVLLDGGDQYQGTNWFGVYKGDAAVKFMNYDKYDAMTLGNHEFDNGIEGIIPFIAKARFPIIAANLNVSKIAHWPGVNHFSKSTIVERSGVRIGIIGYLTPDTKWLSNPGPDVDFLEVLPSVQREARRLKSLGVKIIIGLGHVGIQTDQFLAREIRELDIVVGGHTNTFLYTGVPPSNEKAEGPYPIVIQRKDGSKAVVVQGFTRGKYLGRLNVNFDKHGDIESWSGNPILLDSSFSKDSRINNVVREMSGFLKDHKKIEVGKTLVHLEGGKFKCRVKDCSLGNLVTDAVIRFHQRTANDDWSNVASCIWNSGALRSSISKKGNESITMRDIQIALPFGNTSPVAMIPGHTLKQVFEWSLSKVEELAGRFLQVSGIKLRYDPKQPVNHRVKQLRILCLDCSEPKYVDVQDNQIYRVIANDYILNGGDGYAMLRNISRYGGNQTESVIVSRYISMETPIMSVSDGRISQVGSNDSCV